MSTHPHIRFGTNIIGFYGEEFWGLPRGLTYPQWVEEFHRDAHGHFEKIFDAVVETGLTGVELAPDPAGWETALAAYGSPGALKRALTARGLTLTSSYAHGRQLLGNAMDDSSLEHVADDAFVRHAQFLAEMEAPLIVSGNIARSRFGNASPDDTATPADFARPVDREVHERLAEQLNRVGALIAPYGVTIAIHTDAYSVCSRNEDISRLMSLTDPATIGLCPDAGHITLDGGDPVAVLREQLDRIPTMHWKDCAGPVSGHTIKGDQKERHAEMLTHFRVLGEGIVDWESWVETLKDARWSGWAIEEIDHSPAPVDELRRGLDYFTKHLAPIYG